MTLCVQATEIPTSARADRSIAEVEDRLKLELSEIGLSYGAPIFIRIFKQPRILELWIESENGTFRKFKNYEICSYSGSLGPKLVEGDNQSPEGFYFVNPARLNPWSQYHLSLNLGFPNQYDRHHGRSGSYLMIHGKCVSIGCYAMTDPSIKEIYALAVAALQSGQHFFRIHAFPFKLEEHKLAEYSSNPWYSYWVNLKEGYDYFNIHKKPPNVEVDGGLYTFGE